MYVREFIKDCIPREGSQNKVAAKCGLSQGTISNIMNGISVGNDVLIKIAIAYNKPLSFFLSDMEPQHTALMLSDSDVDRIADAIVAKLKSVLTLP